MTERRYFLYFFVCCIGFFIFAWNADISNYWGGGDTAYFMRSINSLVNDGDIWLTKNELSFDYYLENSPITLAERLIDSEHFRYSIHPHGLVFFLAPFYWLGGKSGVVYSGAILNVLGMLLLYLSLLNFGFTARVSLLFSLLSLWNPLVMGSAVVITPDVFSFPFMCLLLFFWSKGFFRSRSFILLAVTPLVILMGFIHLRFLPPGLIFVMLTLLVNKHKIRLGMVKETLPALGLLLLWYGFNCHITGRYGIDSFLMSAGNNAKSSFSVETFLKYGFLGTLWDQQTSIFLYAPFLCFFPAGLYILIRKYRKEILPFLAFSIVYILICASYFNWSGQWGTSGRFMAVLVPFFALCCAYVWRSGESFFYLRLLFIPIFMIQFIEVILTVSYPTLLLPMNPSTPGAIVNQSAYFVYLYNKFSINLIDYVPEFICSFEWDDVAMAIFYCLIVAALNFLFVSRKVFKYKLAVAVVLCSVFGIVVSSSYDREVRPDPIASDARWKSIPMRTMFNYEYMYLGQAIRLYNEKQFQKSLSIIHIIKNAKDDLYEAEVLNVLNNMHLKNWTEAGNALAEIEIKKLSGNQKVNLLNLMKQIQAVAQQKLRSEVQKKLEQFRKLTG
jgi:hypothetical protein